MWLSTRSRTACRPVEADTDWAHSLDTLRSYVWSVFRPPLYSGGLFLCPARISTAVLRPCDVRRPDAPDRLTCYAYGINSESTLRLGQNPGPPSCPATQPIAMPPRTCGGIIFSGVGTMRRPLYDALPCS